MIAKAKRCTERKCSNKHYAKGVCAKHYKKSIRYIMYSAWRNMRQRCNNPNYAYYKDYGGRGITVCERWNGTDGLNNFLADMPLKPSPKHSLDRKDNSKGYSPDNCRWATPLEQNMNMRIRRDNTSGCKGVGWDKRYQKWRARIKKNGKEIHLGYFETKGGAIYARNTAL